MIYSIKVETYNAQSEQGCLLSGEACSALNKNMGSCAGGRQAMVCVISVLAGDEMELRGHISVTYLERNTCPVNDMGRRLDGDVSGTF